MGVNWLQALAGAFLGLIFGAIASDIIKRILAELLSRLLSPMARNLSGTWDSKYWHFRPNGSKVEEVKDRIHLRQLGSRIWGKNESPSDHKYRFVGTVRDNRFITGTWFSTIGGETFHGTFQLWIPANGSEMHGRWLGIDDPNIILHGEWHLKKVG